MTNVGKSLGAKSVWGKVILYLKQKKYITLQIACGDILEVEINGNDFVLNTNEQIVYDTIMLDKNIKLLKEAFNWQNLEYNIVVNRHFKKEEYQKQDFEKLKMLDIEFKKVGKNE